MSKEKSQSEENVTGTSVEEQTKRCGIIMPISDSLGYSSGHWRDVLNIIEEAFAGTEFTPNLVSKKDSIGLIHESIVTNIFTNEIAVCDVSTKNPNVMFELGMRLAFDKPVIIIKDEKTDYSFDTGPIEHLSYPSSLRFQEIVSFKEELKNRALATYEESKKPNFSPFLKSFNKAIVPGKIENVEVKDFQSLINMVQEITSNMDRLSDTINKDYKNKIDVNNSIESRHLIKQIENDVIDIIRSMTDEDLSKKNRGDYIYNRLRNQRYVNSISQYTLMDIISKTLKEITLL